MEQGDLNNFLISFSDEKLGSFLWEMPEGIKELHKGIIPGREEEWQTMWRGFVKIDIQNLIKSYLALLCGMLSFPSAAQELRQVIGRNLQKVSEESINVLKNFKEPNENE